MNLRVTAIKILATTILFTTISFSQVTFTGFPIDMQLFGRDVKSNEAEGTISGVVQQTTGYTSIELEVLRNGISEKKEAKPLSYVNNRANYSFIYSIKAELANRTFVLNGINGNLSTELAKADNVVAGDVIVIEGQSNAEARQFSGDANVNQNEFIRVYGSAHDAGNFPKQWFQGNGNANRNGDGNTGQWGIRLARQIMDNQNVPIAVFNGAHGGRPVEFFERNDADPTDLTTNYGRLLTRLMETGLAESVIGVFWHQGESNATGNFSTTTAYKDKWMQMYADWKTDFSSLKDIFLFQIRMACGGDNSPEGYMSVQEAHRQIAEEISDIYIISTTGADHHTDQCHYPYSVYETFGDWAYALMAREVYGETPSDNIDPPQITQIAQNGNQLLITLKNNQGLIGMGDFHTEFRLEGSTANLTASNISNGEVQLTLSNSALVTGLSFRSHRGTASPTIKNNTGMGIVAFKDFPVLPYKEGCTDAAANNYDPAATHDNGNCILSVLPQFGMAPFRITQNKIEIRIHSKENLPYKVVLKDLLGRIKYLNNKSDITSIPIKKMESGQYYLELSVDNKQWTKVVRIKH